MYVIHIMKFIISNVMKKEIKSILHLVVNYSISKKFKYRYIARPHIYLALPEH